MGFAIRQRGRTATAARAEEDRAAGNTAADERPVRSARPGAAARGAAAASSFMLAVARVVRLVTWIVVLIIVAGILLRVLDANSTNTIVRHIHDAAKTLVGPFDNLFKLHNAKAAIAVNWGVAAVVYLIVGSFIAGLIARATPGRGRAVAAA